MLCSKIYCKHLMLIGLYFLFCGATYASFYEEGLVAFSESRYTASERLFILAAEVGEAGADHMLMRLYIEDRGLQRDENKHFVWALKAARGGLKIAQYIVAKLYETGQGTVKDLPMARKWYGLAAKQGHHEAYYGLGEHYQYGYGIDVDKKKAQQYFSYAAAEFEVYAQQGDMDAQNKLGSMYEQGLGVKQSYLLAQSWYQQSAMKGYAVAQYNLGRLLAYEDSVDSNVAEAAYWLDLAAGQGFERAKTLLAQIRESMDRDVASIK